VHYMLSPSGHEKLVIKNNLLQQILITMKLNNCLYRKLWNHHISLFLFFL
jgi:hypothetical protein